MPLETDIVGNLTLRQTTEADYDFLYQLHKATLREYVDQIWSWDEAWQQAHFREKFDPAKRQIVVLAGEDIGMISLERKETELFLAVIEIMPAHQRRGIGTKLIQQVLAEAFARGFPVTLQVLKVNPARRLYERLGFRVVGETKIRYFMEARPGLPDE